MFTCVHRTPTNTLRDLRARNAQTNTHGGRVTTMHAHTHIHLRTHIYCRSMHTHPYTHLGTYVLTMHTQTHTEHTHLGTHMHAHAYTPTHKHRNAQTHTRTRTHTRRLQLCVRLELTLLSKLGWRSLSGLRRANGAGRAICVDRPRPGSALMGASRSTGTSTSTSSSQRLMRDTKWLPTGPASAEREPARNEIIISLSLSFFSLALSIFFSDRSLLL